MFDDATSGVCEVASERCPDGVHLAELFGVVELGDVETVVDVETRLVLVKRLELLVRQVHQSRPGTPSGFGE